MTVLEMDILELITRRASVSEIANVIAARKLSAGDVQAAMTLLVKEVCCPFCPAGEPSLSIPLVGRVSRSLPCAAI